MTTVEQEVRSVLVVGASAAGLSTAEALRRQGFGGTITVLGAETHEPYDRPPLSKQVLSGTWEVERTRLRPADALSGLDVTWVLGDRAVELDVERRRVRTAAGRELAAEAIVIATGTVARSLPGTAHLGGVHVLRTLEDAIGLKAALGPQLRLVVVGEGVLGTEVAATARTLGLDVTVTGPLPAPMLGPLGPFCAGLLAGLHTAHGVRLRLGTPVTSLVAGEDGGRVGGVRLGTGEELPADLVVVAIGGTPATGWLSGSGLTLDDGVVCDPGCRAAPGVYAVGDVARWQHEGLGRLVRWENRTNATEQAAAVAANILGADRPYSPVPYFWTDQFDVKVQVHGSVPPGADCDVVDGDPDSGRFVTRYRQEGRTTGIVGWNMPKQSRIRRAEIAA